MRERTNIKKWIWIPILLLLLTLITIGAVIVKTVRANETESLFNLSERDVLLEVGESKKVELESDEIKINDSKIKVTWISSKPSVATVGDDGTITATAGGETKITAIVEYKAHEYSTSCIVTVKAEGKEYSTYKIRWFTQKKDRSEYEVVEETYERLVGSSVELTELDAKKNCPSNYVLNTEKSTLTGKVKERLGACILEVYFDVAEVQYSVDYYYESATALGTYTEKETKKYTAYAFSKVEVTDAPKTGFVINEKASGTVMSKDSVVAGSKLKVYCDRIRSQVTVKYISGRESGTYNCIYGIGLVNAPADVFSDSIEYKIATYVNGEKKQATADLMKKVTADTKVEFKLDGAGFTYSKGTITNKTSEKKTPSYAVLEGSSDTVYLSATYKTTGSSSNTFGITLSNGKTSREIRFSKQGVAIMMDNTTSGGVLSSNSKTNAYRNAGLYNDGNVFVWAQNSKGSGSTKVNSVVNDMLKDRAGGSYDIRWAILDGVLYCNVEGQTVLRLPLTYLDETWTANQKYEIGFSAYDASAWGDALKISNVKNVYGEEAKALLVTDKKFESELVQNMAYDVFTGSYYPASKSSAAYMYTEETSENTGVAADVKWVDKDNTGSAIGVTLKVGEDSIQYVVQGMNAKIRTQMNHKWGDAATRKDLKKQTLAEVTPFNEDGTTQVTAFVKDGYFHVLYNGVQVYCANMLSLYPEYTPDSEVSVGICSWDANLGLASFSNVTELTATDIAAGIAGAEDWGFYAEADGLSADAYDFTAGSITKTTKKTNEVTLLGSNATWQIEGSMNRPLDGTTADLLMGFRITSGEQSILLMGRNNGFQKGFKSDSVYRKYSDVPSVYAFNNIVSEKFFNKNNTDTRTQESIDFKAVLYKDVLYVWFTDVDGNGGLCWRVPLTEEQFGGFEAGSDYEMGLYFANGATALDGSMTDLKAKMGYQVTGQTEFVSDNASVSYNFCDAIEVIDANVTRWDDFKQKTIGGNLAEEIVTANNVENKTVYAYLEETSTDIYLSTKIDITQPKNNTIDFFGVTVRHGEEERGLFFYEYGVSLLSNSTDTASTEGIPALYKNGNSEDREKHHYYNTIRTGYTFAQYNNDTINSEVYNLLKMQSGTNAVIEWAVMDGVLYGRVNGFVFLRMPLDKLFDGYADWEDKGVQIGLVQRAINDNGDLVYRDIDVYYGDDAKAQLVTDKKLDLPVGNITNMYYEPFTGSYMPDSKGGTVRLYGNETNETQVMNATVTLLEGTNTALHGFTVKSGDSSAQIVVQANNGKVRILQNHGWGTPLEVTSWVETTGATIFNAKGICKVTAVVKDNTLYFFYHDKLAGSVDLYKLLSGYKEGDPVQLGVCVRDPKNGLATFSDISFATGADAVKDITLSNDYEWEIFMTEKLDDDENVVKDDAGNIVFVMAHDGKQISSNGSTGVVQPAEGSKSQSYIYGVSTNMPQMLTTKITLAKYSDLKSSSVYSSNGITIESEGESVQFAIEGIKQQIRIISNYKWNPCVRENIATAYKAYDENGVYSITAIVKDDMLYIKYNENVAYKVALEKLFPEYQSGDSVRLGLFSWDQKTNASTFSDVSFNAGSEVNVDTNIEYATIEYLVQEGSYYNINNGVMSKNGDGAAGKGAPYIVMKGSSATWEVSGTFTRTDKNYTSELLAGFRIWKEETNNMLCVLGSNEGVGFNGRKGGWCYDYGAVGNQYVMGAIPNTFSNPWSVASVEFRAIISNNILYVWIDDIPVWRVELNKTLYNAKGKVIMNPFEDDTAYNFGFYMTKNTNTATFDIDTVKTSNIDTNAVNAFEAAYQEYAKTLE